MDSTAEPLRFYLQPGPFTDPGQFAPLLAGLPADAPALVSVVQGLLLHIFWADRYGLTLPEARKEEVGLRALHAKLECLLALDPAPLTSPRPLERRLVGNCRDFSLVLAAFLKAAGIPARARCGFATYFMPAHFEDHWVVQYWAASRQSWVWVDAQLDALQRKTLSIAFNPLDMPPGAFLPAGQAWQMCRRGEADPDTFGIFEWHGWDFIKWNVLREVLSLNRIEPLPWDSWGGLLNPVAAHTPEEQTLLDRAADLTLGVDSRFSELRAFYEQDARFHAPREWLID